MFQLSMLGSAVQGLVSPQGAARNDSTATLLNLLEAVEDPAVGAGGELQAMLLQLSPPLLQQLDELVTGGMNLPQAARSLLDKVAAERPEQPFLAVLRDRFSQATGDAVSSVPQGEGRGAAAGVPVPVVPSVMSGLERLDSPMQILQALTPLQAGNGASPSSPLPAQLASSLLDMVVPQAVAGKGWDRAIADRVMWMVQGDQQFAKLKLNPPNLGPLEVRVSVQNDQTSVSFITHHAAVKEALEAALPRLREMFDQQSLNLVRADVNDSGAQQGGRAGDPRAQGGFAGAPLDEMPDPETGAGAQSMTPVANGLVDLFV
ncbi:MAG: flagellar hook-length control protein FliK [Chromatiaceae bacterium]|nr:flagellar hook-length control protein FliK [Gammaproteobacteria bacterium]MCP5316084.1 flagellar hook-length control protein FliK [Chromatiaceae bacterium]